ncbi:putative transport accessory protein MmpS4 [Mycobacterium stomatepiae]|uniref:Putative transport accessory protein MmpS4 n=1 Tax=Mycobacterium stomatepiae TaxID=470076 RepID=A0A7I7Q4I7_9MYCO|nr:putative transport accessory protein MmpS4 [Mycobacterium stomatepiae]
MVEHDVRARSDVAAEGGQGVSKSAGRLRRFGRQSAPGPQKLNGARKGGRNSRGGAIKLLGKLWIPLLIIAVLTAGGFTVSRLHGIFGSEKRQSYADSRVKDSKPFNPKHLKYEVFGAPGTVADISYFDVNADPQHINGVTLPWSMDLSTTLPSIVGNVVAQGDSDTIGCRIIVDGTVKSEKVSHEVNAFTYCVLTAA